MLRLYILQFTSICNSYWLMILRSWIQAETNESNKKSTIVLVNSYVYKNHFSSVDYPVLRYAH